MDGDQLRQSFLSFFAERGHAIIPSAPLVPENDPTVLFTTAGMHPLVPYLLGEPHPLGKRLTNSQKCLRTDDIEEVGDASHGTFFEMLGFWSLGDYWKQDSLRWTLEWFTDVLGLAVDRIWVSVFAGDADAPRDDEAIAVWRDLGIPAERIRPLPKHDNWWGPAGQTGPCGPDSELFYATGKPMCGPDCGPGCDCGAFVEIGNNVFMTYNKTAAGTFEPLRQRNIDVGLGLERILAMLGGTDVYATDLYRQTMAAIRDLSAGQRADLAPDRVIRRERIIADHLRAAVFMIADRVIPSNVERGYICRRLIRRAILAGHELGMPTPFTAQIAQTIIDRYRQAYREIADQAEMILTEIGREEERFGQTLTRGLREFDRIARDPVLTSGGTLSGEMVFHLFDTYGFPPTLTEELARERGLAADMAGYEEHFRHHRELSRAANQEKFKGGLADHSERTTQLHTATHLLQQALRDELGDHVHQMGSNITPERLRFDFSHPKKLTPAEIRAVEDRVNAQIARDLAVEMAIMPLQEALAGGALAFFGERYPETVKVYRIGDYSREVCGGPHVGHTRGMGTFRILKAENIGQGVQRIRADLVAE